VLSIASRAVGGQELLGDVSTGAFRPFLPAAFREIAVWALHNIHHPGVRGTKRLVCASYCWPKMAAQVAAWVKLCLDCQRGKVHKHVHLQPEQIPVPIRRFAHVHIDLVGPLPVSSGSNYIFTILDRTTRWPEAIPMAAITAGDCAAALLSGWVQRFGIPETITSDRGAQFTSAVWAALCRLLCISHVQTTAYHPQSNGLVERFHRRLKDALRARGARADWVAHLPWVMLGIRLAWREGAAFTPAEAVYGAQPVLPGQFLSSPESPSPAFLETFQYTLAGRLPLQTAHHTVPGPPSLPEELLLSKFVLVQVNGVQPPLAPLYDGPYLALERSLHYFKLQMGPRTDTVSTHRLKACHAPPDAVAALPPRRGRPPSRVLRVQPLPPPATSGRAPATSGGVPATPGRLPATPGVRRVSFCCLPEVFPLPPPPSQVSAANGRPRHARHDPTATHSFL